MKARGRGQKRSPLGKWRRKGQTLRLRVRASDYLVLVMIVVLIALIAPYGEYVDDPALTPLSGLASVLDGDTLIVQGVRVRLAGIDAPEIGQICEKDGRDYDCASESTAYLRGLTQGHWISCDPRTIDVYGRLIAVCDVEGIEIGEHLVGTGMAVSLGPYSGAERKARQNRRGLWAGSFEAPARWRARHGGQPDADTTGSSENDGAKSSGSIWRAFVDFFAI